MEQDVITSVQTTPRGATLILNGEITLWLSRSLWLERPFQEGESLDKEEYFQWLLPRQYPEALNTAVSLLALRARSREEIRQKLEQKHYLSDAIDMALYKLEKEKLLDDEAFAVHWAADCNRRQMGRQRIWQELRRKGISPETAELAMEQLDEKETEEAALLMAQKLLRRYASEPDERKAMNKLMAAMARRGYGFPQAKAAVEKALEQSEND